MPKSAKKEKGRKKSEKGTIINWSKYPPDVTCINNPNFFFGSDKFLFKNGDKYIGEYCAHKSGVVWREGIGTYYTKDGHSYEGIWENDQLLNSPESVIIYPDGTKYEGVIENGKYSGFSRYIPKKDTIICSRFKDNKITGPVKLLDPNKNSWTGNVKRPDEVTLFPDNHFYTSLSYDRGIGKEIKDHEVGTLRFSVKSPSLDSIKLKDIVFNKSMKTLNDFKESLMTEQLIQQYERLKVYDEPLPTKQQKSESGKSLLEKFWSKEFRNSCEPISVFTPTVDIEKGDEKRGKVTKMYEEL